LKACASRLLFFVDEPALRHWDRQDPALRDALREAYSYLCVHLGEAGHYFGVHTCAPFHEELLSLPFEAYAFELLEDSPGSAEEEESLSEALRAGKVLVLGAYPAVCDSAFERHLTEGDARVARFLHVFREEWMSRPSQFLWSAQCGHAQAPLAWLDVLYAGDRFKLLGSPS